MLSTFFRNLILFLVVNVRFSVYNITEGGYIMETTLIRRIKAVMIAQNITQADLVRMTKIRASSISDYLSGKYQPKQDKISLIADALSVSPGWLMGYSESEENNSYINPDILLTKKEISLLNQYRSLSTIDQEFITMLISSNLNSFTNTKDYSSPKLIAEIIPIFNRLDFHDQLEIKGEIKGMLKSQKYNSRIKKDEAI